MRTVDLLLDVPGTAPQAAYDALADFPRYPELAEAVRSVEVTTVSDTVTRSSWEVTFRSGLLRWSEEDTFDRAGLGIAFHQLDGDIPVFDGTWLVTGHGTGSRIVFSARLDMGIPSLADALEPIAARTLVDNTVAIVRGLLGEAVVADCTIATPASATQPVAVA